jgi:hypothetical protein
MTSSHAASVSNACARFSKRRPGVTGGRTCGASGSHESRGIGGIQSHRSHDQRSTQDIRVVNRICHRDMEERRKYQVPHCERYFLIHLLSSIKMLEILTYMAFIVLK